MKKIITICFCLLFLCGCSSDWIDAPGPFSTPRPLTVREQNERIAAEAYEAYLDGEDYWDAVQENLQPLETDSVYWTPGGRSYHSTPDCVALLHSTEILNGTLNEAFTAGKQDPCSKCVGD